MATLCYAEHVHIAQTRTGIPTSYFCVGQESVYISVSKSVPESVSGNVKRPSHQGIFEVNKSCRLQAHPNCVGAFEGWIVVIVTEKKREDGFRRLLEAGGATVTATK